MIDRQVRANRNLIDRLSGRVTDLFSSLSTSLTSLTSAVTSHTDHLDGLPLLVQGGRSAVTTNGSGQATITFPTAFDDAPAMPMPAVLGTSTFIAFISTQTATSFTVTVENATSGAALASTSITIGWIASGSPA